MEIMKQSLVSKYINAAVLFGLMAPTAPLFSQNNLRRRAVGYVRSAGVDLGKGIRRGAERVYKGAATGLTRIGTGLTIGQEAAITRAKKEHQHFIEGAKAALKRMRGKSLTKKEQDHLYSFEKRAAALLTLLALIGGRWAYTKITEDDGDGGAPAPGSAPSEIEVQRSASPAPSEEDRPEGPQPAIPTSVTESQLGRAPELTESILEAPVPPLPITESELETAPSLSQSSLGREELPPLPITESGQESTPGHLTIRPEPKEDAGGAKTRDGKRVAEPTTPPTKFLSETASRVTSQSATPRKKTATPEDAEPKEGTDVGGARTRSGERAEEVERPSTTTEGVKQERGATSFRRQPQAQPSAATKPSLHEQLRVQQAKLRKREQPAARPPAPDKGLAGILATAPKDMLERAKEPDKPPLPLSTSELGREAAWEEAAKEDEEERARTALEQAERERKEAKLHQEREAKAPPGQEETAASSDGSPPGSPPATFAPTASVISRFFGAAPARRTAIGEEEEEGEEEE
jgi:hypothetical protein